MVARWKYWVRFREVNELFAKLLNFFHLLLFLSWVNNLIFSPVFLKLNVCIWLILQLYWLKKEASTIWKVARIFVFGRILVFSLFFFHAKSATTNNQIQHSRENWLIYSFKAHSVVIRMTLKFFETLSQFEKKRFEFLDFSSYFEPLNERAVLQ